MAVPQLRRSRLDRLERKHQADIYIRPRFLVWAEDGFTGPAIMHDTLKCKTYDTADDTERKRIIAELTANG